ncbi:Rab2b [Hexamita inflata]|uniref:Rab2b n=1 Tax=Hexamita inflata TaxID=28002 RepID=A0AA86QPS2_9EUKA|nr:Rab2b [Hexamita inflata]
MNDNILRLENLVQQLNECLNEAEFDQQKYMYAITNIEKLQLNCILIENVVNPTKQFLELLDIAVNKMEGYELWKKIKLVSAAYQMILIVYIFNKNKVILSNDCKTIITSNIKKIRGQIKKSKNSENKLMFYLDTIETGINVLDKADDQVRESIVQCISSVLKIIYAGVQGNYDDLFLNSLQLVNNLQIRLKSKVSYQWFQKLLIFNVSVGHIDLNISQNVLNYVQQFIEDSLNDDWHLTYAGLDIIQKIFENLGTIQQHFNIQISILAIFRKLSKHQTNKDSWHIREKIAEICILHCNHIHVQIQQELQHILLEMKQHENNDLVKLTLINENISEQAKQCLINQWSRVEDEEIKKFKFMTEQLQSIHNIVNSNVISTDQYYSEVCQQLHQMHIYHKQHLEQLLLTQQNNISTQLTFQIIEISSKLYENFSKLSDLQSNIQQIEQQLIIGNEKNIANFRLIKAKIDEAITSMNSIDLKLQQYNENNQKHFVQIKDKLDNLYYDIKAINDPVIQYQKIETRIIDYIIQEAQQYDTELYVPHQCIDPNFPQQQPFNIEQKIVQFLNNDNKQVLLITGDANMGKTILCQHLTQLLLKWQQWDNQTILPIYVNLSKLDSPYTILYNIFVTKQIISQDNLQKFVDSRKQFLLILDEFEIKPENYIKNIYQENAFLHKNCKVIFTCRNQFIQNKPDNLKLFCSDVNKLDQIQLVLLKQIQIEQYINKYCQKYNYNFKLYIANTQDYIELLQHPFILVNLINSQQYQQYSNQLQPNKLRSAIMEDILSQWYQKEIEKNAITNNVENIKQQFMLFSQNIALALYEFDTTQITCYNNQINSKQFTQKQILLQSLLNSNNSVQNLKACPFFSHQVQDVFYFNHNHFYFYIVSNAIIQELCNKVTIKNKSNIILVNNKKNQANNLYFNVQKIQENNIIYFEEKYISDHKFKQLFHNISHSKSNPQLLIAFQNVSLIQKSLYTPYFEKYNRNEIQIENITGTRASAYQKRDNIVIIIVGPTCTGKSTLVYRFLDKKYNPNLCGSMPGVLVYHFCKIMINNQYNLNANLVELRNPRCKDPCEEVNVVKYYCKQLQASIVICTYDITSYITFTEAQSYIYKMKNEYSNIVLCLCGTKCDDVQYIEVPTIVAQQFASDNEIIFYETSALEDVNVSELFSQVINLYKSQKIRLQDYKQ